MSHIKLILALAAVVMAMLEISAVPAMAKDGGSGDGHAGGGGGHAGGGRPGAHGDPGVHSNPSIVAANHADSRNDAHADRVPDRDDRGFRGALDRDFFVTDFHSSPIFTTNNINSC